MRLWPSQLALCATAETSDAVAAAFDACARQLGLAGVTLRLSLNDRGAHVVA